MSTTDSTDESTESGESRESGELRELRHRLGGLEAERDAARDAQRAAEQSLRVRDEILAVVIHDLRNPLGTIVMGATALQQAGVTSGPNAQRIRTVAERIERQAGRMVRQLAGLTDFIEIQTGRLAIDRASHAPSALIAAASEVIGPLARERNLAFEVHAAGDLPAISCDAERVVQALFCLCSNAIKVTASGGALEIGARRGDRNRVELFVRDHGPGIDSEDLATLFEPSWRSKLAGYKGAGLGFAIARGIAAAHGGRIWADSAPGAGTTVYFTLGPED